ncbi:hypothetical protein [uncultured Shimia sp.]|uniref:hypothetical protein n=1 Tax=uncultured Shimia sp. TaxID=573152 RepID=UPI002639C500|nr:hypothetical protein [uncultured Shimia sp.]
MTTKLKTAASIAMTFGVVTLITGGSALFAGLDMGHVVPFVLWFNFLAGGAYVLAGWGLWTARHWAMWLAAAIAFGTLIVALGFSLHVLQGGAFETRTIVALILRAGFWLWIFRLARTAYADEQTGAT